MVENKEKKTKKKDRIWFREDGRIIQTTQQQHIVVWDKKEEEDNFVQYYGNLSLEEEEGEEEEEEENIFFPKIMNIFREKKMGIKSKAIDWIIISIQRMEEGGKFFN